MKSCDAPGRSIAADTLLSFPAEVIDASGGWLFWKREPDLPLRQSLIRQGQIFPLLVDAGGSRPVLVAGAARLACLAETGRDALCLDTGPLDAWERGFVYLESNIATETTDWRVISALRYFRSLDPDRLEEVFPALGLEPRARRSRQALAWLRLPEKWDRLLVTGNIPLVCADALQTMDEEEREALFPLFAAYSWSRGNAVNLLTWLRETALREGRSASVMVAAAQADLSPDLSPKDAMNRITAEIRRLRYPSLSALERNFSEAARRISAGTGWKLIQPDQFETEAVELSIRLTSTDDVIRAAQRLSDMASADWSGIFPEKKS